MEADVRRELRLHRLISTLCFMGFVALAAWNIWLQHRHEVTVERLNVVEADGRLRLVISNSARQAQAILNGRVLDPGRTRPAGLIFFNDEGDENGGLVFSGKSGKADAGLTFDQYRQDQVVALQYQESAGKHSGGLYVWDRAEMPLDLLIDGFKAAEALPEPQRTLAMARLPQSNGARRVFVGKDEDRSSEIALFDQLGRPRLRMRVDPSGQPTLEFLNANGTVLSRLPSGK
jgi:hypothetical protein